MINHPLGQPTRAPLLALAHRSLCEGALYELRGLDTGYVRRIPVMMNRRFICHFIYMLELFLI
jgi:hypothetical protein